MGTEGLEKAAREHRREANGLGLRLTREIARAHGGEVLLMHSSPEDTWFRLALPALDAP